MVNYSNENISFQSPSGGILGFISLLRHRPGFFIQHLELKTLYSFLTGVDVGMRYSNYEDSGLEAYEKFSLWTHKELQSKIGREASWYHHILSLSKGNEEDAYEMFFPLFEKYLSKDWPQHRI